MDYQKHYNLLVEKAKLRTIDCYTERHHIIPKCMGGTYDKENLVKLTPEEHYVAHQLLVKIYPTNRSLIFSARMMGNTRNTNKTYGWLKRRASEASKGVPLSEETKKKISATRKEQGNNWEGRKHKQETKDKIGKSNSGRSPSEETRKLIGLNTSKTFKGKHLSDAHKEKLRNRTISVETRKKISEAKKGKKQNLTDEQRAIYSNNSTGRIFSAESKAKKSASLKGKPKSEEAKENMRLAQLKRWEKFHSKSVVL